MSQRVTGFTLVSIAIVGIIAAFSTADNATAQLNARGFAWVLSYASTFGGLPLGLTIAAFVGVGLLGVGLLIFGKSKR